MPARYRAHQRVVYRFTALLAPGKAAWRRQHDRVHEAVSLMLGAVYAVFRHHLAGFEPRSLHVVEGFRIAVPKQTQSLRLDLPDKTQFQAVTAGSKLRL